MSSQGRSPLAPSPCPHPQGRSPFPPNEITNLPPQSPDKIITEFDVLL
ncbi:MAG TPA: hypothetical protein IGS52_07605 [Oscillatoriaceae cyanobacterium M33_DOE_052]|nr:hypothetical protein [Oscillatoriaceae cyanobacterium M33_DOE_052]